MIGNNMSLDDVKKKIKGENDKYMVIDPSKENPDVLDPYYLKPTSGRKLWKVRHGYKLKKRNKRLEKKGIFNA